MPGKASIILVIGFGLIMGYMTLSLHDGGKRATHGSSLFYETTIVHNLAVAGAHMGLAKVFEDTTWGLSGESIERTLTGGNIPGSYIVDRVTRPDGSTFIRSRASYSVPGTTGQPLESTVEVYLGYRQEQSFTMYAWMTNNERNVKWVTSDTVWGRVHTNDKISVNGYPVFKRKLTTVNGFNYDPGTGTNMGDYQDGWESGVARIDFPTDLSGLVNAAHDAAHGGRYYDSSMVWVTLDGGDAGVSGDGKAFVRLSEWGPPIDTVFLNPAFNGVIMGSDSVQVKGELDGRLTIASLKDIYVMNDITYEQDPRYVSTSDDMLGLVAERSVVVVDNIPNRDNCIIHASIFTRDSSFRVDKYDEGYASRGYLLVLGSIIQDTRGSIGTYSGGVPVTGYSKRYVYDDRLANPSVRPPFFPGFYPATLPITAWWESPVVLPADQ
jgi:hypothetical protein